jgi:uncharacterized protein involved in exopolysaccharide biosynthesis
LKLVRKNVPHIALGSLIGGVIGLMFALFTTPVYRGTTVLLPIDDKGSRNSLMQLAGDFGRLIAMPGFGAENSLKVEAVATLQSHALAQHFIVENNLIPVLFADRWNPIEKRWTDDEPTMNEAVELWEDDVLSTVEDRRTGLVTVAIEWYDADLAAQWANMVVATANDRLRERALAESRRAMEVLESELSGTDVVGVQQGIYQLIESNLNQTVMASVRKDYAFRVVDLAVAADSDQFVRPQRALLIVLGVLFGAALSCLFVIAAAGVNSARD